MPTPKPILGQSINSKHSLAQNLIVVYPFIDASGLTLTDFSGNGHHGTLGDVALGNRWITDEGGALNFIGLDLDQINMGAISGSVFGGDFTIIVKHKLLFNDRNRFLYMHPHLPNTFSLKSNNLTNNFELQTVGGSIFSTTGSALPSGAWHRLVCTRTSGFVSMYLDGALILSPNNFPFDGSAGTGSGKIHYISNGDVGAEWYGHISDFRVYDRGFTSSDVALDFADPWQMFLEPPLRQKNKTSLDQLRERVQRRLATELGSFVYNPELGSELYLLTRAKNLDEVYALAEREVRLALRPEIQKGHILEISEIRVKEKTLHTASLEIDVLANNQERVTVPVLIS